MTASLISDFKIYVPYMLNAIAERAAVVADVFNQKSNGALVFETRGIAGDFEKSSFFTTIADLVTRQDLTSLAAPTILKPGQDEFVGVKVNQKVGPVQYTLNSIRRMQAKYKTPEAYSVLLGEQIADAIMQRFVTVGIKALVAAITGNTAMLLDRSTTEKLTSSNMIDGRALFGDASDRIICWVTHSTPWHNLLKDQASLGLDTISGVAIAQGTVASGNVPMIKTDNASLVNSAKYYNLGLVEGALTITESEAREFITGWIQGLEQAVYNTQGELAFNVDIKGFKYDFASGLLNPSDATIGTTTNWDQAATDDKDTAGICVYTM